MIMRIAGFDENVCFDDTSDTLLVIKDHKLFSKIILEINNYLICNDNNQLVFINKNDDIIKSRDIICINDIINFDFSTKQLIKKLYLNISKNITDDEEKDLRIRKCLNDINIAIIEELEDFNLDFQYDYEIDLESYFKLLNIKIGNSYESVYDKTINFIEIYSELFNESCIVFVNLLSYLDDMEIEELNKYKKYKKVNVLFIENNFDREIEFEKFIIDNDLYMYKN